MIENFLPLLTVTKTLFVFTRQDYCGRNRANTGLNLQTSCPPTTLPVDHTSSSNDQPSTRSKPSTDRRGPWTALTSTFRNKTNYTKPDDEKAKRLWTEEDENT